MSFLSFAFFSGVFDGKPFKMIPEGGQNYLVDFITLVPSYLILFGGVSTFIYSIFFMQDSAVSSTNAFRGVAPGFVKFQQVLMLLSGAASIIILFLLWFRII